MSNQSSKSNANESYPATATANDEENEEEPAVVSANKTRMWISSFAADGNVYGAFRDKELTHESVLRLSVLNTHFFFSCVHATL